jgi:hypothetical protein
MHQEDFLQKHHLQCSVPLSSIQFS